MVSHYLVSGIQLFGLVVGTFGVFYLSQGLFGRVGNQLLRRLLSAIPMALFFALWGLSVASLLSRYIAAAEQAPWLLAILGGLLGFLIGYSTVGDKDYLQRGLLSFTSRELAWQAIAVVGAVILLSVMGLGDIPADWAGRTLVAVLTYAGILVFDVVLRAAARLVNLSDKQLQLSGLVLTLLGIATQFISPILDLFSIPVH